MDNNEARFLLGAYRPNGADAQDPALAEALAQAGKDPVLAAWLREQQAVDRAVADKVRQVAPPPELRDALLAGAKVSLARSRPDVWVRSAWALAACLAFALTLWLLPRAPGGSNTDAARLAAMVREAYGGQPHSGEQSEAERVLLAAWSGGRTLPEALRELDYETLKAAGCRTVSVGGHEALELCFGRSGGRYHLYVMRRIEDSPTKPFFGTPDGVAVAVWSDRRKTFGLVGDAGEEALRSLL